MIRPRFALLLLPVLLLACGARVEDPGPSGGSSSGTPAASGTSGTPVDSTPSKDTTPSKDPGPVAGGNCTYKDITGTATVVALDSTVDNVTIGVCHRARTHVTFTFAADDPSLLAEPATDTHSLTVGDGSDVPTSCLQPAGLQVGATFAVTRREAVSGSCSPLIYDVPKTSKAHVCDCVPCDETGAGGCF